MGMIYGTEENDTVRGNKGSDTIYGGAGDDLIYASNTPTGRWERDSSSSDDIIGEEGNDLLRGGSGNDIYRYNLGDGNDNIYDYGEYRDSNGVGGWVIKKVHGGSADKIVFGEDISKEDVTFKALADDLFIYINKGDNSGQIKVENFYHSSGNYRIESVEFSNGDILTYQDIYNDLTEHYGTDIADVKHGNDLIDGGEGDDSYIINHSDWGNDTISDSLGSDRIDFLSESGINLSDIKVGQDGSNLIISKTDDSQSITIENYFASNDNKIETIKFADGSSKAIMDLFVKYIDGTDEDDSIYGTSYKDSILGAAGNDTLRGWESNDTIHGGEGDDLIYSHQGSDIIYGDAGNDTIFAEQGDDTIYGNEGDDVIFGKQGDDVMYGGEGNDLYVIDNVNSGNDFITDSSGVNDEIRFESSISKDDIAIFMDSSDNLVIDYDVLVSDSQITVQDQSSNTIEKVSLSNGEYLSDADINQLIQDMTAYATDNGISMTSVADVKNNTELMNIISNSWHS